MLQAKSAIQNAHQAIASQAGITIARKETISNLRSRLRRKRWNLPKTEIQLQQYNWYDKHAFDSLPSFVFHPTMTAVVRRDVQNVLGTLEEIPQQPGSLPTGKRLGRSGVNATPRQQGKTPSSETLQPYQQPHHKNQANRGVPTP